MQRRTNFLLGLVLLAAAIVLLLRALNQIPDGIFDLVVRAWPVLLVFGGLTIFLRERVRLGGVIALVVSGLLVAGVVTYAFSTRAIQERDDYQQALNMPMSADVTLLRVQVDTLNTDVELVRALDAGQVTGQFVGSTESKLEAEYNEGGDSTATLIVREEQPNNYPLLAAVGRGRLTLELPPEVGLDISFKGGDGDASLNLNGLAIERLNMDLRQGNALVTLPEYDPQASAENDVLGVLAARNGDVTVMLPATVGARLELANGSGLSPVYDANVYNLLANGVLEARNYDTFPIKLRYVIEAPRGVVTLEVVEPGA